MIEKNRQVRLKWYIDFININLDGLSGGERVKLFYEIEEKISRVSPIPAEKVEDTVRNFGKAQMLQQDLRNGFQRILTILKSGKEVEVTSFALPAIISIDPAVDEFLVSFRRDCGGDEVPCFEQALYDFANLLNGVPWSAVRKCEDCNNYFFHFSKKEKIYCSYHCAWRATSRKRREADPEGYRKKQRELMKRRYHEKKGIREIHKP